MKRQPNSILLALASTLLLCSILPCHAVENLTYDQQEIEFKETILQAEKDGIGVKAYLKALEDLELSAKLDSKDESIQKLKRLQDALNKQLNEAGRSSFKQNLYGKRPITDYCVAVENLIAEAFKRTGSEFKEHCLIELTVLANGKITKLRADPEDDCKKVIQNMVLNKVAGIKFPPPPKTPLNLSIEVCKEAEQIDCSMIDKIDYGAYQSMVTKRIKLKWKPAREKRSSRTVVLFQILRDGSVKDEKVTSKSYDPRHDQAALDTIRACAPFPKLPDGSQKSMGVEFTFSYNVFGK